ncbi:MAG: RNA polymerase sigma factor [Planctomycetes bacterium]|nr:RNA polymerase sigma factor [Planctomycetota bacterium]
MNAGDPSWEERGLRDAVLAGDASAWKTLYERHFGPLYAHVHHRAGRRRERTEDVVAECWMIAVRKIRKFDPGRGSLEGWLRGIADNVLRNRWRAWRREDAVVRIDPGDGSNEPAARHPETGRGLELAEQVSAALSSLPVRYQEVLRAKYEEELSVVDIAVRSGETTKAVESLLSRAREAFRAAYSKTEGGGSP